MVVTLGTLLRWFDIDELLPSLPDLKVEVEYKTDKSGKQYIARRTIFHIDRIRIDDYEELFRPSEIKPYSKRYFHE